MHIQGKASIHTKHGGGILKLLILNIYMYIHIHTTTHTYTFHESIVPLNNSRICGINHKTRSNLLKNVTIIVNTSITNTGEGYTTNTITYAYYDVMIFSGDGMFYGTAGIHLQKYAVPQFKTTTKCSTSQCQHSLCTATLIIFLCTCIHKGI
jgi:hypothetical protein